MKQFVEPKLEIVEFNVEDVITTSFETGDPEDNETSRD